MAKPAWQLRPDPVQGLDRWLLERLALIGSATVVEFAESPSTQTAGGDELRLTPQEVENWLRSAERRGLVQARAIDLRGSRLRPPSVTLTDAGRERLRKVRSRAAYLPQPLRAIHNRFFGDDSAWERAITAVRLEDPLWEDRGLPSNAVTIRSYADVAVDDAEDQLRTKVDHIVVLMLENRSFDHMLGYLRLQGQLEVDGLTGEADQVNRHAGHAYFPRRLGRTRIPKSQDPCHSVACVEQQLRDGNGGFVANFATEVDAEHPGLVMGYYTGEQVPVYDYLAHSYCICDRWHSSVPGSTWPNRLFAVAGRADPERESVLDGPLFNVPSFVRHLKQDQWRWYSHDPASLRAIDERYRPGPGSEGLGLHPANFRFFDRKTVTGFSVVNGILRVDEQDGFLDDARKGELPAVSWIDPNFIDLSVHDRTSNDDHPPSDVRAGQLLVLDVYRALVEGPPGQWEKTLLIVTYDEHGGFYDHVPPPPSGDPAPYVRYGVRVPAFVISPWVERGAVSHTLYDHTSILKTILLRFSPAAVNKMGRRVAEASHVGGLLTRSQPGPPPDFRHVVEAVASWRADVAAEASARSPLPREDPAPLDGFPAEMLWAARELRQQGLPSGQP